MLQFTYRSVCVHTISDNIQHTACHFCLVSNSGLMCVSLKLLKDWGLNLWTRLIFPTFKENENVVRLYGLIYFKMMSFSLSWVKQSYLWTTSKNKFPKSVYNAYLKNQESYAILIYYCCVLPFINLKFASFRF